MSELGKECEGLKTFFVVPDLSLMPEDFLPHFFLQGFETYYILDDQRLDLVTKMEMVFSLFPDSIIFFNTDRRVSGVTWPSFIAKLKQKYQSRARLGILYGHHIDQESRRELERIYLYELGLDSGCIPVEYHKATNLARLTNVLRANQANGRRKHLRAICGSSSTFNLVREGAKYEGMIRDISVSHFSCVFEGRDPEMPLYEKTSGIQLKLAGIICTVDAVISAKRCVEGAQLYVFVFRGRRDHEGLDSDALAKVNGYIHSHFEKSVAAVLRGGYEAALAKKRENMSA